MVKWIEGRQKSGYFKRTIFSIKSFRIDCHILKFPTGSYIDTHLDTVDGGWNHYRLNIVLRRAKSGGRFWSETVKHDSQRIIIFRPDKEPHGVTTIHKGTRYVLSFGWLTKKK